MEIKMNIAQVAPRAGAWIETPNSVNIFPRITSRPVRARGLKRCDRNSSTIRKLSRPVRARGLKLGLLAVSASSAVSRPVRARGLKLTQNHSLRKLGKVAPRAGAWIETKYTSLILLCVLVAPRAGVRIESRVA